MAKRTIHMLVDDIDGGEATETVRFALDGIEYEIDLSGKNAEALRKAFQPYTAVAAKGKYKPTRASGVSHLPSRAERELNDTIRRWANTHGYTVAVRGRIGTDIVKAYHAQKPAVGWTDPAATSAKPEKAAVAASEAAPKPPVVGRVNRTSRNGASGAKKAVSGAAKVAAAK